MNYDMAAFYAKAVGDWHDSALKDGMLTDTAPFVGIHYCAWVGNGAHPLVQRQLYQSYGESTARRGAVRDREAVARTGNREETPSTS